MNFLKNTCLKIIVCLCCIHQTHIDPGFCQEIELSILGYPEFILFVISSLKKLNIPQHEQEAIIELHERMQDLSKNLQKIFYRQSSGNNALNAFDKNVCRMFHGFLSNKIQGQLFMGIEQANDTTMQEAIAHGANVNQSINGLNPLQYAIRFGDDDTINFLIDKGAIIKPDHISLAEMYIILYKSNLNENDMVFPETIEYNDQPFSKTKKEVEQKNQIPSDHEKMKQLCLRRKKYIKEKISLYESIIDTLTLKIDPTPNQTPSTVTTIDEKNIPFPTYSGMD